MATYDVHGLMRNYNSGRTILAAFGVNRDMTLAYDHTINQVILTSGALGAFFQYSGRVYKQGLITDFVNAAPGVPTELKTNSTAFFNNGSPQVINYSYSLPPAVNTYIIVDRLLVVISTEFYYDFSFKIECAEGDGDEAEYLTVELTGWELSPLTLPYVDKK